MSRASTSYLTPAKKTWMAGTSPAMTIVGNGDCHSFRGLRHSPASEIYDGQGGADALGGAVLEADDCVDRNVALAAIDGVDDGGVLLVDDAAADFPCSRKFAVIGVELLV